MRRGQAAHGERAAAPQWPGNSGARQCKLLVALVEKPHSATSTAMRRGTSNCVAAPGMANSPGECWAEIQQLALIGSSSSLHSEACNALGASDGVIHSSISHEVGGLRASTNCEGKGRGEWEQSVIPGLLLCSLGFQFPVCSGLLPFTLQCICWGHTFSAFWL